MNYFRVFRLYAVKSQIVILLHIIHSVIKFGKRVKNRTFFYVYLLIINLIRKSDK